MYLYYQPHALDVVPVLPARGDDIYSGSIGAAVTEDIRELCYVLFNSIKHTGEKMTKIVWKNLCRIYVCFYAEIFHFSPNIRPAYWRPRASNKNRAFCNFLFRNVFEQFLLKFINNKNAPRFSF